MKKTLRKIPVITYSELASFHNATIMEIKQVEERIKKFESKQINSSNSSLSIFSYSEETINNNLDSLRKNLST